MFNRIKNFFRKNENISDGYHTFKELYSHRDALFMNLCIANKDKSWWSWRHTDGTEAFGRPWAIVGIGTEPGKQITYHINTSEFEYWENFSYEVKYFDFAPTWDFHTPSDVIHRLKTKRIIYN